MAPYLSQSKSQGPYNDFKFLHHLSHFLSMARPHILPSPNFILATKTSRCFLEHNGLLSHDLLLRAPTSKNTLLHVPLHGSLPYFFQVTLLVRSYLTPLYEL